MTSPTHRAIDAVWRIEAAKVIAGVARLVRDVGLAEEFAQDALVSALEHWPASGLPDNPGAWLMAAIPTFAQSTARRSGRPWPGRSPSPTRSAAWRDARSRRFYKEGP